MIDFRMLYLYRFWKKVSCLFVYKEDTIFLHFLVSIVHGLFLKWIYFLMSSEKTKNHCCFRSFMKVVLGTDLTIFMRFCNPCWIGLTVFQELKNGSQWDIVKNLYMLSAKIINMYLYFVVMTSLVLYVVRV